MVMAGISRQTEYRDWDDKSSLSKIQVQFSLANTIYKTLHAGVATTGMNGLNTIRSHSWFYGMPTEGQNSHPSMCEKGHCLVGNNVNIEDQD